MINQGPLDRVITRRTVLATTMAAIVAGMLQATMAVELDVPYVETPDNIVTLMLDMAEITDSDHVIDLGTGDGRIVIGAVKRGATGLGVDLDPQRIEEARLNAEKAGVSDRVKFEVADLFETDISAATVVTLFLNSEVNMRLRPALFAQLKPGTRVVSHNFDMEDWQPNRQEQLMLNANNNFYIHDIFYWVIPADISGEWEWTYGGNQFQMNISQQFQLIQADISVNGNALIISKAEVNGDKVEISGKSADGSMAYIFKGQVAKNSITGTVETGTNTDSTDNTWSAIRKSG